MGKLVGSGLVMNQATNDSVADQHKTKGSGMIPIYRDRAKEKEEWACVKCGEISHSDHTHGPNNGVCQCVKVPSASEKYRENYDQIKWNHDKVKWGEIPERIKNHIKEMTQNG